MDSQLQTQANPSLQPAGGASNNKSLSKTTKGFLIGNVCILIATIFWGVNVSVTKALMPTPETAYVSAFGIIIVRLIGGCILMWITSLFIKCAKIQKQDWLRLILGGAVGLFLFIFLFILSLKYGDPIDISIIMTLPPIFVIVIGIIFLKQRPSWYEYVGVIISFIGAAIVILYSGKGRTGSNNILGDVLAIASTLCYAFYLVILEKPTKTYKPITMLRWVFLFAAIPALVLVPFSLHQPIFHTSDAIPWIEIAFILFCVTFLAYFLVEPAIKNIGSELTSLYQYLLPVFATISAVLMGLSHLKWMQVIAMGIIIIGMVFTTVGKRKRSKKEAADTSAANPSVASQAKSPDSKS